MNGRKRPTLLRIIDSDYTAAMAILVPVIFWLMFWLLGVLGLGDPRIPRDLVMGLTAASLLLLAWRCWLISRIFDRGVETPGEIEQVWFYRDRGRLSFTFTWEGQKLAKNTTIPKNNYTETLRKGQAITLIVDRNQPKRAFLRDLYLRK
jgi:hypothetical protein